MGYLEPRGCGKLKRGTGVLFDLFASGFHMFGTRGSR